MIQGLWDQQDEAIIGIKLVNADIGSENYGPMAVILPWW